MVEYIEPDWPWHGIASRIIMRPACQQSHVLTTSILAALLVAVGSTPNHVTALTKKQREDPNVRLTDDAVVIEAWGQVRHRRSAEAAINSGLRASLPHPPCFTAAGQLGRCTSFRECYPYFKVSDVPSYGPLVFGSHDTCSYFGDQIRQPDVFQTLGVCCTSPVVSAEARPALGSWPPPLPPLPTHPPDHSAPTHPPGFGLPGGIRPTHSTTKKPFSTTTWGTKPTTKKPFSTTTWGTKPTTFKPWPPTQAPVTLATTTQSQISSDHVVSCGGKNGYQDQERIVGGHSADLNEWPWIVALFNGGKQFCGGSLINDEHILSAAHCVAQMTSWDVARLTVRLGDHDLKSNTEVRHIERKVKRVVRHRGFDIRTLYNDVAVLTLDSPVKFSNQVRPICLPYSSKDYAGTTGTVIGWGSLRENGIQPAILQEVSIPIWDNSNCRSKYGAAAPGGIVEHMICAGQSMKDSCSGDSGGPLMVGEGGRWTQVGIVSWGIGCGKGYYPGVYSRVSFFLPWIKKNSK